MYTTITGILSLTAFLWLTTSCLRKTCQLIFCSLSVKYQPITAKMGRVIPE